MTESRSLQLLLENGDHASIALKTAHAVEIWKEGEHCWTIDPQIEPCDLSRSRLPERLVTMVELLLGKPAMTPFSKATLYAWASTLLPSVSAAAQPLH